MGRLKDSLDQLLSPPRINPLRPEEIPDLTLAYRELNNLAHRDGDLGTLYWNSIIKLLAWAEKAHQIDGKDQ